jgi:hypothetical protein
MRVACSCSRRPQALAGQALRAPAIWIVAIAQAMRHRQIPVIQSAITNREARQSQTRAPDDQGLTRPEFAGLRESVFELCA